MSTKICGAKTRAGTPCRRPAGWGTDHVGEGCCKLHGGCTPRHSKRGPEHPEFKHGLYSKHLGAEETVEFEEFAEKFALTQMSQEELFVFYKLMRILTDPETIAPDILAKALHGVAKWRRSYHEMIAGKKVEVVFGDEDIDALLQDVAVVLIKYVPEARRKEALNELKQIGSNRGTGSGA